MKWFRKRVGHLTFEYFGRSIHSDNNIQITYESYALLWKGVTKYEYIKKIKIYDLKTKRTHIFPLYSNDVLKQMKDE